MLLILQGSCRNVLHTVENIESDWTPEGCPKKPRGVALWALPGGSEFNYRYFEKIGQGLSREKVWVILRATKGSAGPCNLYGPVLMGYVEEVLGEYVGCKYWPEEGDWRYFFTIKPMAVARQADEELDRYLLEVIKGPKRGSVIEATKLLQTAGRTEEEFIQELLSLIKRGGAWITYSRVETPIRADVEALAWVLLLSGKNLLLVGAPGVGKTQLAVKLARMAGSEDPVVVTGRDGLTYDELIFGRGNRPGRLAEAVARSWANLKGGLRPVHLVFDEINRANTDLALGEVFTALDVANRWVGVVPRDAAARAGMGDELLSQFKGEVPLPLSFRVLATMNVVDRAQLFKLSFALLRRFAYLYVAPPWFEWSPTWSPGDAKADLGGLQKFFESAVGELKASNGWDKATIFDISIPAVDEVLNAHQRFLEFVVWTARQAGDVGLELGISALVDVFKALAVYEGLKRGDQLELGVERLYDGLYSSLVVHQLAAAVPRLKFNYILGIDHELKRFRGLLGVAKSAFGDRSLTRLVVQSIASELPVEGV